MDSGHKTGIIKDLLLQQGFERVGIAGVGPAPRGDYVRRWLAEGRSGHMGYLQRHVDLRLDPARLLPGARSVIVVALNYRQSVSAADDDRPRGRVAMYAWGNDYHQVIRRKLDSAVEGMRARIPEPFDARPCVDTAPIIERDVAMQAGVGWIGKNTMVLHQQLGSYFVLGEIITTLDLLPDPPATDHCGSCTRCLDACPTGALPAPYEMDARRCISYHTIELREDIAEEFHEPIGDWLFGCDICQDVCPFNTTAPLTTEPEFAIRASGPHPPLEELLAWEVADYREQLRHSAMKRAKPEMLKRNAAIALANIRRRN